MNLGEKNDTMSEVCQSDLKTWNITWSISGICCLEAGDTCKSNRTSGGCDKIFLMHYNNTENYKERQVTGLWKKFQHYSPPISKEKDPNTYVLEVASGHR